jgi:threonyl-tRNA synthetase
MEWVPYVVVVGQREIESGVLPVRDRKTGELRKLKLEELSSEIEKAVKGMPFRPLPLPKHLSKRPQFYG